MWIIGLTGALGSGKSLISSYFRYEGIPVHCADQYVHFLFEKDHDVQQYVKRLWPEVVVKGKIDRLLLGERVLSSSPDLNLLESLLYPKLAENQRQFLMKNQSLKKPCVVLDVPLLFEVGLEDYCSFIILSSAPSLLRKQRVMKRQGMTTQKFYALESLQIKEWDKRKKVDLIIYTGRDKGNVLQTVQQILFSLSQRPIPQWQGKWPKNFNRRPYEPQNCFRHRNNRV